MARTLIEAKLKTRADRDKLPPSSTPYWRAFDTEVHLGYRKGRRGGTWLVRWRNGKGYQQKKLGAADDELREGTLDFAAAERTAREMIESERRSARAAAGGAPLTVATAIDAYVAMRDERETLRKGRPTRSDANRRMARFVTGREAYGGRAAIDPAPVALITLHELGEDHLIDWRDGLPDLKWTSKQRLVNDVKAALNLAFKSHRRRLDPTFPTTVKHGLLFTGDGGAGREDAARANQAISDIEVTELILAAKKVDDAKGWEGDLHRIVAVMAATGARFSQIARLQVGDVQTVPSPRLRMPTSHKGNGFKNAHTPVPVDADLIDVLKPVMTNRPKTAPLLERWRYEQVPGSIRWQRSERGEWRTSSELNRLWNEMRIEVGKPDVIQYALRHSSIIRWLKALMPAQYVAVLHDTSEAMIRRHYGRYIVDRLDDIAAAAVVPLMGKKSPNVVG